MINELIFQLQYIFKNIFKIHTRKIIDYSNIEYYSEKSVIKHCNTKVVI